MKPEVDSAREPVCQGQAWENWVRDRDKWNMPLVPSGKNESSHPIWLQEDGGDRCSRLPEKRWPAWVVHAGAMARGAIFGGRILGQRSLTHASHDLGAHRAGSFFAAVFFLRRTICPLDSHIGGVGRDFGGGSTVDMDRQARTVAEAGAITRRSSCPGTGTALRQFCPHCAGWQRHRAIIGCR